MGAYGRVMLKLSGEVFGGSGGTGLDKDALSTIAGEIVEASRDGAQIAVVVGGGNILRGAANEMGIERTTGDYMGMLATVINAMALQSAVENLGMDSRVLSALEIRQVCEFFIRRRAIRHMEKGRVVILAGGTGNPYFTTDTAAALRATELECEVVLKATKVDGVYDDDPATNPDATRFESLSHQECITRNLRVMDQTAFSLCMENGLPVIVFSLREAGNIGAAVRGEAVGTRVG